MRRCGKETAHRDLTAGTTYSIIGDVMISYILGWVTILVYLPLSWWRHSVDKSMRDKKQVGG